ncbi:glycosyltransferase family 1 protein [Megamonas hypermegale]|uniref:glycosyltransferase family 1 protein n=1 Tax=Megamonas hypermegale TaxID=158847 RepID=UPI0026F1B98F|nr:glycosyltransferase family 1 protein [Megamonas hypermegale]
MKQPIRVLQIIGFVCGGGVEAVIMNYYRNIDRNKIQFDFVIDGYEKTSLDNEISSLGGKVYKVEPYTKNPFKNIYQIYRIVKDNNYQIVHSNMNTLSIFSLFAAWLAGAKVRILHNHSTAVKSEKLRSAMKYILRPFAPIFANEYLACSKHAGEWMYGKKKMEEGKVKVLNNAINVDDFAYNPNLREKLRHDLNIDKDTLVIGHVGRFMYQKNHDFLIDIFKEIHKQKNNSLLLLIGDGSLRATIEAKVQNYGLKDCVKFLGLRKDVKDLYNVMDVFVLPSWYEGLPVVSVEAQANGLSCFVSDKVSKECNLSSSMHFISLDENAEVWSKAILGSNIRRNKNAKQELIANNFEIKNEVKKLIVFYRKK